jgi:zinc D-Ala-D-Ala dipeptidase
LIQGKFLPVAGAHLKTPPSHPAVTKKRRPSLALLAACLIALLSATALPAQSAASASSLTPGPKPADAPPEWKQLVGIYDYTSYNGPKQTVIILELNQHLFITLSKPHRPPAEQEEILESQGSVWIGDGGADRRMYGYGEQRDPDGDVKTLSYLVERYTRVDAGSDPGHFYHIAPSRPIEQLRKAALLAKPSAEPRSFRKPDLVELAPLDSALHLDIRYAQSNNFLSTPVYTQARAFLQRPAAQALLRVLLRLQPLGYGLLIHDAYRPWYVTKIFWDATPPEGKIFVADPKKGSKHNRGCAVDITLYELATGNAAEMPGLYDEMSPRSFPNFPGGTSLQRWHRDLLRRAMESEGFTVNEAEWWHFDYKDWKQYPILNVRFEDLGAVAGK